MGKKKQVKFNSGVQNKKQVSGIDNNIKKKPIVNKKSTDNCRVIWHFHKVDNDGCFAFSPKISGFKADEVIEKLLAYSKMTWAEVKKQTHDNRKSKNHSLEYDSLSKEAKERISALKLEEDIDSIFSFALQNKLRIIGLRDRENFIVLWYDSEHRFCPSKKKHT